MNATGGIDTWKLAWYLRDGSPEQRAARHLADVPTRRGSMFGQEVEGHRVGFIEGPNMLWAEGHPEPEGLACADPEKLQVAADRVADGIAALGLDPPRQIQPFDRSASPGFAGVSRLDITCDLLRPSQTGRAILAGVAAIRPPGALQVVTHRQRGGRDIETVSWEGARGRVARAYDKGVESGSHERGERVRFEDQRRWASGHRRTIEELDATYVAQTFRKRFEPLWRATEGIIVTGSAAAAERIKEAVIDGELSPERAVKAMGYLALEANGVHVGSRTTQWRHRQIVEELGIAGILDLVQDGLSVDQAVEVNLHQELEQVVDAGTFTVGQG